MIIGGRGGGVTHNSLERMFFLKIKILSQIKTLVIVIIYDVKTQVFFWGGGERLGKIVKVEKSPINRKREEELKEC